MLSQWFFILGEVIKISETLWILFPGKSTQHIWDVAYHFRRFTGTFWNPSMRWGCKDHWSGTLLFSLSRWCPLENSAGHKHPIPSVQTPPLFPAHTGLSLHIKSPPLAHFPMLISYQCNYCLKEVTVYKLTLMGDPPDISSSLPVAGLNDIIACLFIHLCHFSHLLFSS